MKTVISTLLILLLLALSAGAVFIHFGVYNVAATEQDDPIVFRLLHYTMLRSVARRAAAVQVPDLDKTADAQRGFDLYHSHCLQCHGAPGIAPDPFGLGLRPAPPNLAQAAREWRSADLYWVIKHGVSKTAMPGWEFRLDEQQLWDLTAFVKQLPTLSPLQYRERARSAAAPGAAAASGDQLRIGDPVAGRRAIAQYLCATCHTIPGVAGIDATVGPPLAGIARRAFIGGVLVNTPENMVRWLRNPQQVDPLSAMPDLRIKETDLRDIAAYLYTLDQPASR